MGKLLWCSTPVLGSVLALAALTGCGSNPSSDTSESESALGGGDGRSAAGGGFYADVNAAAVRQGERDFMRALPTGNGRACATCHVPEDDYMLKPASAEARYQRFIAHNHTEGCIAHDALFNSIDANDAASDYTNLRRGLVQVHLPIPANITIDELPGATTMSVWRKVPTINDVAFRAPYQLDGRAATLQIQALGAARGHSQVTEDPPASALDALAAFQLTKYSNARARAIGFAIAAGQTPPSPFPEEASLSAQELRGKAVFNAKCVGCHGGATTSEFDPKLATQRFHNVMSNLSGTRNAANLKTYTIRCTNPDGTVLVRAGRADPGRGLITGVCNDISRFEARVLFDVANHAPYFHDGSAATLEDVMATYNQFFFALPASLQKFGPPMSDTDTADVIAFVKRL